MTELERKNKFAMLIDKYFDILNTSRITNAFEDWGFFRTPASVNHHGNYEGGLFDHSLAVTEALLCLTENLGLKWQRPESPIIVGMFHDLCKCYSYEYNEESGQW
jgi:23S rRNA maturation-related 3'-5' exoribonuclease YhaM